MRDGRGGDINAQARRQIDQVSYGQRKVMNCLKRKGQCGGGWTGEYSHMGRVSLFDQ